MVSTKSVISVAALASLVSAGTLHIPFKGVRTSQPRFERHQALVRRMSEMPLENLLVYYEATLEIGTPSQELTFTIDTGSSDLWVMDASNPYCASSASDLDNGYINCSAVGGTFDSSKSSSFEANESFPFNITYGDNSFANGYYSTDTVKIAGSSLDNAIFAVATECNSSVTVFGIAPVAGEASVTNFTSDGAPIGSYNNIPAMLKEQGVIDSAAYSLWLNDLNAAEGSVLFGGVDHSKYVGTLQLVPMVSGYLISDEQAEENPSARETTQNLQPYQPFVMLNGIYGYNSNGEAGQIVDMALPVLLDSGTSLSVLPTDFIEAIAGTIGAEYSSSVGLYITYCNTEGGLALDFSGALITVPYSEFLVPLVADDGTPVTTKTGQAVCQVPMTPGSEELILGDVFLRSMYCVFDNDNFQVAIANTRFNTTDTNIDSISGSIPSATKAASYSSTSSDNSYSANILGSSDYTTTLALVTASNVGSATAKRSHIASETDAVLSGTELSGDLSSVSGGGTGAVTGSGSVTHTGRATTAATATGGGAGIGSAGTSSGSHSGSSASGSGASGSSSNKNAGLALGVGSMIALPLALMLI